MAIENIIEIKELCYSYDGVSNALNSIDINIKRNSTTAILGSNGAGKSTLFLSMNGVIKPDSGDIIFDGELVSYDNKSLNKLRRLVGIVFQDPNDQVFSSNVYNDIAFGLINMGIPSDEIDLRVKNIAKLTGVDLLLDRPVHALSFGQKKRVAIAGVIVMRPDVVILDEPTAGLDPEGVSAILHLFEKIRQEFKMSVIISTHDIDIVPLYCDYVYVLSGGNIVMKGSVDDILSQGEILRKYSLRLPRISHLMEILHDYDNMDFSPIDSTISKARKAIKRFMPSNMVFKGGKELKKGYTTGSCAAATARASAIGQLTGEIPSKSEIKLPKGETLTLDIINKVTDGGASSCGVIKYSGDDPDVTNGIEITARVEKSYSGIIIDGGEGVGRVTKQGLKRKIGEAAINPAPYKMIEDALKEVADIYRYHGGFRVVISAKGGADIAKNTFNDKLGIVGGISILGTTGIVEPMSEQALIDTIYLEIDVVASSQNDTLILIIGNYGETFAREILKLDTSKNTVKCSNFIADALDYAAYKGFKEVQLIGHFGKLIKLAGGIGNTHSKTADCRAEIFASHAAMAGADKDAIKEIMNAATAEAMIEIIEKQSIKDETFKSIFDKVSGYANRKIKTEIVAFWGDNGCFVSTSGASDLIKKLMENQHD